MSVDLDSGLGERGDAQVDSGDGVLDAEIPDQGSVELNAEAGESRYALVGESVTLDGSASTGAVSYQWDFGDGTRQEEPSADPRAEVNYTSPGRYRATLTVADALGVIHRDQITLTVTHAPTHTPRHSDTLAWLSADALNMEGEVTSSEAERAGVLAALITDDDAVMVFALHSDDATSNTTPNTLSRLKRIPTADEPRSMIAWSLNPEDPVTSGRLAVACQRAGLIQIFEQRAGELIAEVAMPPASRPYGVTVSPDGQRLFVTLQGTGQLAELTYGASDESQEWTVSRLVEVGRDPRGVATLPDGRIIASRWRSPDDRAELWVWDPSRDERPELWPLAYDPQAASDTEIGGVPNYLDQLLVSPSGREIAIPSTQANYAHGLLTSGLRTASDEVLRAIVSWVDVERGEERFERRKQFDGRGLASAGVYSRFGDYLYLAMRGSRTVERLDTLSGNQAGSLVNTGRAVEGLALSSDDRLLFVNATLDRVLKVYDVSDLSLLPTPLAELSLVDEEPLSPTLLLGKQLFNDSADPRLSSEGYIACAHCHLDGDSDHRTWDFSDRGEGLRQTTSLLGRSGMGHGPIHWSANFDEGQDFELDIRLHFGGLGLMSDADFNEGECESPLSCQSAGVSADLDALAAYMTDLSAHLPSPHRDISGELTPLAARGMELFFSDDVGCAACHIPPRMTDSQFTESGEPLLHHVGTLSERSGGRLGGELTGLDTPTLHGLWHSAPYLHDGSASTLRAVLTDKNLEDLHGQTSTLSGDDLSALEAYLLSLDGRWE